MKKLRHLLRILILYAMILLTLNYLKILINSPFVRRVSPGTPHCQRSFPSKPNSLQDGSMEKIGL